jgi:thiamine pyrophosphate-dependent acetolactate synthase large subunit-like protein
MSTPGKAKAKEKQQTAGRLLIRSLVQQGVKHIFGIPGGKIMPTFDVLREEGPKLILYCISEGCAGCADRCQRAAATTAAAVRGSS